MSITGNFEGSSIPKSLNLPVNSRRAWLTSPGLSPEAILIRRRHSCMSSRHSANRSTSCGSGSSRLSILSCRSFSSALRLSRRTMVAVKTITIAVSSTAPTTIIATDTIQGSRSEIKDTALVVITPPTRNAPRRRRTPRNWTAPCMSAKRERVFLILFGNTRIQVSQCVWSVVPSPCP